MNQTDQPKIAFVFLIAILVFAPWSIDLGQVGFTLQTFIIFIGASLLSWPWAGGVVLAYLLIGALGLPVFGGHTSGYEKLYGATSGFLWGFIVCAIYIARESAKDEFHFFKAILVFLRAHLLLLIPGFLVLYLVIPEADLWSTLVKLLPGLLIKSILGGIIASQIRKALLPDSYSIN